MSELTPELLLRVANKVEPEKQWIIHKGKPMFEAWDGYPLGEYMPQTLSNQQLLVRNYLAQRGVFLLIAYCDDDKTKAIAWTGDEDNFIAEHEDINVCAVLAVDALEAE